MVQSVKDDHSVLWQGADALVYNDKGTFKPLQVVYEPVISALSADTE